MLGKIEAGRYHEIGSKKARTRCSDPEETLAEKLQASRPWADIEGGRK